MSRRGSVNRLDSDSSTMAIRSEEGSKEAAEEGEGDVTSKPQVRIRSSFLPFWAVRAGSVLGTPTKSTTCPLPKGVEGEGGVVEGIWSRSRVTVT